MDDRDTRTETARRHDDRDLVDRAEPTPAEQGRSGGGMERDIGSEDEQRREGGAEDAGVTRVTKQDEIEHDERQSHFRRRPDK